MANWDTAYAWMMNFEDPRQACKQVPDAAPSGVTGPCYAISGINSGAWPVHFALIAAEPQETRTPLVKQFYQDHFWGQWYDQIENDELAKRVFDMAVNAGSGTAVRCLQRAVNAVNALGETPLGVDGIWGPNTLTAVNAADPEGLVETFKLQRSLYYQTIAKADPGKVKYLVQWTKRANA